MMILFTEVAAYILSVWFTFKWLFKEELKDERNNL